MIIALIGPAGSGKTTLARMLNADWRYTRFADPVKVMLDALLKYQGVNTDGRLAMLDGELKNVPTAILDGRTPRHAMQTLGTEWRDMISRNLWANIWESNVRMTQLRHRLTNFIVDDMRFPHEEAAVRALDGKIIRIEREGYGAGTHLSEQEFARIRADATITNNGEPVEMLTAFLTLMETWKHS